MDLYRSIVGFIEVLEGMRKESRVDNFLMLGTMGPLTVHRTIKVLEEARKNDRRFTDRIDVILYSGGGQASDAYRIIKVLRHFYDEVNIIIPFWAKSAATLLAFGADRIVMGDWGELGPLDAQIIKEGEDLPAESRDSALNIQASLEQIELRSREGFLDFYQMLKNNKEKNLNIKISPKVLTEDLLGYSADFYAPLLSKIDTEEIGRMSRAVDIGRQYAKKMILQYHPNIKEDDEKIDKLINYLVFDCPEHGFVIDYVFIKQYLNYVISPTEVPYSEAYSQLLHQTYQHLIEAELSIEEPLPPLINFVDDLYDKFIRKEKNGKNSRKNSRSSQRVNRNTKTQAHSTRSARRKTR